MKLKSLLVYILIVLPALAQQPAPPNPARLIGDLDHPSWRIKEAAFLELRQLGDSAVPALQSALNSGCSDSAREKIALLLSLRRPNAFDADFNGWHWVYSTIVHAQTFEATGVTVDKLKLRVAQLSVNRPIAPLEVEIRDKKLENVYVKGTIDPGELEREFRWQIVGLKHVSPLKSGETYVLVFHSRANKNTSPWAINCAYKDVYPTGRHWYTATEDFFFHIEYRDGISLRVGPKSDEAAKMKTPINSGAEGGAQVEDGGGLRLQTFGNLPVGKLQAK